MPSRIIHGQKAELRFTNSITNQSGKCDRIDWQISAQVLTSYFKESLCQSNSRSIEHLSMIVVKIKYSDYLKSGNTLDANGDFFSHVK